MSDIDVFLVGAGIQIPLHLTIETIEVLASCKRIVTNLPPETVSCLPSEISSRTDSLWPLYQSGRLRRDNYADVTAAVLTAAEASRPIAWLTVGHPSVLDSVTSRLLRACVARGWASRVVPAISSIDTLFAALGFEPAGGVLICEATSLARREISLNPMVAAVLMQPGAFQNDRAMLRSEDLVVSVSPLVAYLRRFYSGDHRCALVRSATKSTEVELITWMALQELDRVQPADVAGATLFLPAVEVA